jgi:hypothetical protein
MNYKAISNEICHIVEQMNKWSSTITTHQGGEYLDKKLAKHDTSDMATFKVSARIFLFVYYPQFG